MKVPMTMFPHVGDWCWLPNESRPERICLTLPRVGTVRLRIKHGEPPSNEQVWGWNGDLDQPTLAPSIDTDAGDAQWHGWLRDGVLTEQSEADTLTP